jgi:hypothetical protein
VPGLIASRSPSLAHRDIQHQFRVLVDGHERIAIAQVLIVLGTNTFFFLAEEAPNLVALHVPNGNVPNGNVPNVAAHDFFALLASNRQEFQDRIAV